MLQYYEHALVFKDSYCSKYLSSIEKYFEVAGSQDFISGYHFERINSIKPNVYGILKSLSRNSELNFILRKICK